MVVRPKIETTTPTSTVVSSEVEVSTTSETGS